MAKHVVGRADELPCGNRRVVQVEGREIALFNIDGSLFAISNKCPHEGASLCSGTLIGLAEADSPDEIRLSRKNELLRCPWHGWEFDVKTGLSWCDPKRVRVKSYGVSVESGEQLMEGPFKVDTFPISVEGLYLVVEINPRPS